LINYNKLIEVIRKKEMEKNWGEGIALRVRKSDYMAPSSTA
jgi:hypothetical protein